MVGLVSQVSQSIAQLSERPAKMTTETKVGTKSADEKVTFLAIIEFVNKNEIL